MDPGRTTARLSMSLRTVSVRRGDNWVLRDITLRLDAGERWALIGDNGAGKTQLLKLLAGDVWPTPTGRERRIYRVGRREVDLIEAKARIAYVGAELQDKYTRYGWDLERPGHDCRGPAWHGSSAVAGNRGGTSANCRDTARLRSRPPCGAHDFPRCRTARSGSRCWRARWPRSPIGCCWTSFTTDWMRRIAGASTASSTPRAPRASSWIAVTHRAGDVPRGTRGIIELHQGRLRSIKALRRARAARWIPAGEPTGAPQASLVPGRRRAYPDARWAAAAADRSGGSVCQLSAGAARSELGVAPGSTLGGVRRKRLRQDEFPEIALRRSVAGPGWPHRARRLSRGHADLAVEAASRLRIPRIAGRLRGGHDHPGSGGERAAGEHRPRRAPPPRRIESARPAGSDTSG